MRKTNKMLQDELDILAPNGMPTFADYQKVAKNAIIRKPTKVFDPNKKKRRRTYY